MYLLLVTIILFMVSHRHASFERVVGHPQRLEELENVPGSSRCEPHLELARQLCHRDVWIGSAPMHRCPIQAVEQGVRGAARNGRDVRNKRHARAKTLYVHAQLSTAYV